MAHTEEELRIIVSESYKSGEINQSEFKYVNKIFEFDDRIAKEIMVPRTEIATVSKDDTIQQFFTVMAEENLHDTLSSMVIKIMLSEWSTSKSYSLK